MFYLTILGLQSLEIDWWQLSGVLEVQPDFLHALFPDLDLVRLTHHPAPHKCGRWREVRARHWPRTDWSTGGPSHRFLGTGSAPRTKVEIERFVLADCEQLRRVGIAVWMPMPEAVLSGLTVAATIFGHSRPLRLQAGARNISRSGKCLPWKEPDTRGIRRQW